MNLKARIIADRIESLEEAIRKAKAYLESGEHSDWSDFRPLFTRKLRKGNAPPPHEDWVKNVFLPRNEKALSHAEKIFQRLNSAKRRAD